MELVNYVQGKPAIALISAGAIVIGGVIIAKHFDKIAIKFRDITANFEKKSEPEIQATPPNTAENVGNIVEEYEGELTNQTTINSDVYNIPAGNNVNNAGNIKKTHKDKVDGGTTTYQRTFDLTK
ncbi:unnamed protein product [Diamesa tonsa]